MKTYKLTGTSLSYDILSNIIYDTKTTIKVDENIVGNLTNKVVVNEVKNTDYTNEEARAILVVLINSLINRKADINLINKYVTQLNNNDTKTIVDDSIIIACAQASILIKENRDLLKTSNLVIATSLDGYNGNTSPFIEDSYVYRPYPTNLKVAQEIINHLKGSSIFIHDVNKPVQDPLSFRDAAQINGAWLDCINYLETQLLLQINSTNDFSCDNWILAVEELGNAIGHSSKFSCYRTLKFCDPDFTKLPRFLAYNDSVLGFATLQKVYCALDAEIRYLSNPVSFEANDYDNIYCISKTRKIIDNLRYILGIELMHACQAIDLRIDHHLGENVSDAFEKYRKKVEMYKVDRIISNDIEKSYQFIMSNALIK